MPCFASPISISCVAAGGSHSAAILNLLCPCNRLESHLYNIVGTVTTGLGQELVCPLTRCLFEDAVCLDGSYYSRAHLTEWLEEKFTDPKTHKFCSVADMLPGHVGNNLVEQFNLMRPDIEALAALYTEASRSPREAIARKLTAEQWTSAWI